MPSGKGGVSGWPLTKWAAGTGIGRSRPGRASAGSIISVLCLANHIAGSWGFGSSPQDRSRLTLISPSIGGSSGGRRRHPRRRRPPRQRPHQRRRRRRESMRCRRVGAGEEPSRRTLGSRPLHHSPHQRARREHVEDPEAGEHRIHSPIRNAATFQASRRRGWFTNSNGIGGDHHRDRRRGPGPGGPDSCTSDSLFLSPLCSLEDRHEQQGDRGQHDEREGGQHLPATGSCWVRAMMPVAGGSSGSNAGAAARGAAGRPPLARRTGGLTGSALRTGPAPPAWPAAPPRPARRAGRPPPAGARQGFPGRPVLVDPTLPARYRAWRSSICTPASITSWPSAHGATLTLIADDRPDVSGPRRGPTDRRRHHRASAWAVVHCVHGDARGDAGVDRPGRPELADRADECRGVPGGDRQSRALLAEQQDATRGARVDRVDGDGAGQVVDRDDGQVLAARPVDQLIDRAIGARCAGSDR